MKIMVRVMGLTVIGLCISICLMHSFDIMVRYDELDKASSIAMSNTQIVMMENIEDAYYGTSNARRVISDDLDYISLYKENFDILTNTNSVYTIKDYRADCLKGLLYVDIECRFKTIRGNCKVLNKKLLNIVDVIEDEEMY